MTERLVIVGNGMAPGRMLEHLLEAAPDRYQVTIFNAEPRVNYDRIMLSPVLSGEKAYEDIIIHGDGWYIKHGITLYKGHKIVAIDRGCEDRHLRPWRDRDLRQARHRHRLGSRSSSRCPATTCPAC
jgi:nitrite reductase (NADH) large subunit